MKKRRILISATNKTGIEKFKALTDSGGWEIISTSGTAKALEMAGIPCIPIEQITGFPEMMYGRLKTLHPNIFGGILADRDNPRHIADMEKHGIKSIDIVVVNLYAFRENPGIENIDIGGTSLLRAAAKNGKHVTVIINPNDYDDVIREILENGNTILRTREDLAGKVFHYTSLYDEGIKSFLNGRDPLHMFDPSDTQH